ncbi:MAG: family 20 glycosylhydrolase [Verrucomicrobiota bacterium]|nr:family 20 glycosylhydrolase [Verrucomicrobiota bacterium]
MHLDLLPPPQRIKWLNGFASSKTTRQITASVGRLETGAYRVNIQPDGTTLTAADAVGLFYAEQTLAQIDKQYPDARPCLEILDWPAFPVRGFYHDVTRGKVPTLKTLMELAETCARYKINHLELYIEHTYAYKNHPEVWAGADPLTADDIRTLDARCAELHIDLVPSFSTFGHFYTWIHHKFPELNELERDVSPDPFCWWDRMMHYTLDCQNPRSIALVREIIQEVRPLFRSKYFNVCCDETFDLGKGRNKALASTVGNGRLYVDFLKNILLAVHEAGAMPLFWGDIIGHYPELLNELPKDAIALDWDYSAALKDTKCELIAKAERPFYICPGISGWNGWLPDYSTAQKNITRFARKGKLQGASGLLNTDWGDYGHINTLGPSLPGIIIGASAAWHPTSATLVPTKLFPILSRTVLGDKSGTLLGLLAEFASAKKATWQMFCWCHQPRSLDFPASWFESDSGLPGGLFKHTAREHRAALAKMLSLETPIRQLLDQCKPQDPLILEEIAIGILGLEVLEEYHLIHFRKTGKTKIDGPTPAATAVRLRNLEQRLSAVWLARNKPSEYYRIKDVLLAAACQFESQI